MSNTIQGLRKDKLVALLKEWRDTGKFKSVAAICRHFPVDPSYISQIKSGHRGFGEEAARTLEDALGLPKFYFEPDNPSAMMKEGGAHFGNARLADNKPVRYAPVFNLAQAAEFFRTNNVAITEKFEPVIDDGYGERVYWIVLEDDSMEPDFSSGEMILIDPDLQPNPADYVLAKEDGSTETTFKKWRPRGFDEATGKAYVQLIASNPDYPVIDSRFMPFSVCGVAVERKQKLR
ncbi:LexA family protein [Psychrobacter glaciei]|uniref:LexA family protein n=1 Tax=Psychrobacter glaciei TaxID=619771 RepID=UPI003F4704B9|tara:strand:+ start:2605 stop:3306 length:702 start_codon:yes stop_codon:yes gene_type:complete